MAAFSFFSPFMLGWLVTAVTVAIALRAPRRPYPATSAPRHPALGPLVVALAVIVTRLPFAFNGWFLVDENLDCCIFPFDLLDGRPLWGGSATDYLSAVTYLAGYRVFGFSPLVAHLRNPLAVAAAAALLHVAVRRATDWRFAWISSLVIILAGPYVGQSLYATPIGCSVLPTAIALLLLVGPVTAPRTFALGPLAAAAIFLHPSSPIAIAALTAAHALVFRHLWSGAARLAAVAGFGAGATLVPVVRWLLTGQVRMARWDGGSLDFASAAAALRVLARDLVWASPSFNANNLGGPYVDTALLAFVVVGITAGWRERDARWRWACLGVVAFVATILAVSVAGLNPGIRRAYAALPLLGFALARGVVEFGRRAPRALAVVVPVVAMGLVAWHTARLVASWPVYPEPDFIHGARTILAAERMAGHDVVVVGEPDDGYGGAAWRCALGLDKHLAPRLGRLQSVPRRELQQLHDPPRGPLVVLASHEIDERVLAAAFGRPPVETIVREPSGGDPLGLRVVYVLPPA